MTNWNELIVDLERILAVKDEALDRVNRKMSQQLIDKVEGFVIAIEIEENNND